MHCICSYFMMDNNGQENIIVWVRKKLWLSTSKVANLVDSIIILQVETNSFSYNLDILRKYKYSFSLVLVLVYTGSRKQIFVMKLMFYNENLHTLKYY